MATEIVRELVNGEWTTTVGTGGGGGDSLPVGWTGDAANPENVNSNGGNLTISTFIASVIQAGFIQVGTDSNTCEVVALVNDPTTGGGAAAQLGSLGLRTNGQAWLKTGIGNTAWTQLAAGGAPNFEIADFTFTEETTAGTYTAELELPARSFVVDVGYWAEADWAADTMLISVGDSGGNWLENQDIAGLTHYEWQSVSFQAGGTDAYVKPNQTGKTYAAPDTLTIEIVTTIAVPPVVATGLLRARAIYCTAPTPTAATFA